MATKGDTTMDRKKHGQPSRQILLQPPPPPITHPSQAHTATCHKPQHSPLYVSYGGVAEPVFPHGQVEPGRQGAEPIHGLVLDAAVRALPRRH